MNIIVGDKSVQNGDNLVAIDEDQRIFVNYPYTEGKLYAMVGFIERATTTDRKNYVLFTYINIKNKAEFQKVYSNPFIFGRKPQMIYDSYTVALYQQDKLMNFVKEQPCASLMLDIISKNVVDIVLSLESASKFKVKNTDLQLVPGTLSRPLFDILTDKDIWRLIIDYSIDMKESNFSRDTIIDRLLEWQKEYLENRKL